MKIVRKSALLACIACGLVGATAWRSAPTYAHSWYPAECCSDQDCAPVESMNWLVPVGGGLPQLVVTSKHGTAIVPQDFPTRPSKDGRMHVCLQHSPTDPFSDITVICLFMPPSM